ncbi:unnamed protein product [Effrenium voratum]|nr:unnamed protein product [Effrenium voratum]
MRLVLLSGEDTLETLAAVRSGATRMHFWATRAQAARAKWRALKVPQDSRRFLEALLPATEEEREALLRAVYSDKIDDPTWAISVMPPDRRTPEADEDWLERIQQLESYGGELDSFCALLRLAFILLKAFERREAIKRMDVLLHRLEPDYAFHETRQYVALQLAHLALAQVPALKERRRFSSWSSGALSCARRRLHLQVLLTERVGRGQC